MRRHSLTPARTLLLALVSVTLGACDRSPMDGSELDLAALEALAGDSGSGRSVASELIVVATRLQSDESPVPDIVLPTLANLFDGALGVEAEEQGPEAALHLRTGHAALLDSAWQRIEDGDLDTGDRLLAEARGFQASTAARVLGTQTSIAYVFLVGRTLDRVNEGIVRLSRQGFEVRQYVRMAASARDLTSDARRALGRGEAAAALDVGGHAADLVNNLIRLVNDR